MLIDLNFLYKFDTIYLAFSGGIDSTVLLDLIAKSHLKNKLQLIHIHHGVSINADAWQQHAHDISQTYDVPLFIHHIKPSKKSGFEAWARKERYKILADYLKANDVLLTAHHLDDQAETVLMNIARGTGIKGLIGMTQDAITLGSGVLFRPLLNISKATLLKYAKINNLSWIEDESNTEIQYNRNFVRHKILPNLQDKWPTSFANINSLSQNAAVAFELLQELAVLDCPNIWENYGQLPLRNLYSLSKKRIINIIYIWLDKHNVSIRNSKLLHRIIDEVIYARIDADPKVSWDKYLIRRYRDRLYLLLNTPKQVFPDLVWPNFPVPFEYVSGEILSVENFVMLDRPSDIVTITYRKPNAKVKYRGYTKQMSKLYQEWGIPPWERDICMLLMQQDEQLIGYFDLKK